MESSQEPPDLLLTRAVRDSPDVLVCRLLEGKITYVHRRLWPALIRLADELGRDRLAAIHEVHTASGKHVLKVRAFPRWVTPAAMRAAKHLSVPEARAALGSWYEDDGHNHTVAPPKRLNPTRRSRGTVSPRRAG